MSFATHKLRCFMQSKPQMEQFCHHVCVFCVCGGICRVNVDRFGLQNHLGYVVLTVCPMWKKHKSVQGRRHKCCTVLSGTHVTSCLMYGSDCHGQVAPVSTYRS